MLFSYTVFIRNPLKQTHTIRAAAREYSMIAASAGGQKKKEKGMIAPHHTPSVVADESFRALVFLDTKLRRNKGSNHRQKYTRTSTPAAALRLRETPVSPLQTPHLAAVDAITY